MRSGAGPPWRKPEAAVAIGGAAIIAVVAVLQAANMVDLWRKALASLETYASNMAIAVEQETIRSFQGVDLALGAVADAFLLTPSLSADDPTLRAALAHKLANLPYVRSLSVADARGAIARRTSDTVPFDVGDRDYFTAHRDDPAPGTRIGPPLVSRTRGSPFIPASRRLAGPDGRFLGIVLAAIDPAIFERVYGTMDIGRDGAVALMHRNGMLLARTPAPPGVAGRVDGDRPSWTEMILQPPSGVIRTTSPADDVERIYAYRALADFPLVVLVGLDVARAERQFWSSSAYSLFSVGVLSLMIVVATVLLVLAMRRQRRLLDQVRSDEQRFRDFAEVSTDWLYEMDEQFRFTYISPRRQEVTGIAPQERLGRTPFEVASPAELTSQRETYERYRRTLEEHREFRDLEFWTVLPDGRQRCLAVSGRPVLNADGKLVGYRGAGTDLTQQKAAERAAVAAHARLMDAIDSLPDSFALFDAEDRLVLWNKAFERFHVDRYDIRAGTPFHEYARQVATQAALPSALGDTQDAWLDARLARHRQPGMPFDVHLNDGRWFRVIESRTREGGVALLFADITAQRQAEDSLARAQKLEALGQLTGGIAHDFNNLLTVILAQAELLAQDLPPKSPGREMAEMITEAAGRGAALTRQLLAFARRQPMRPNRIDANMLIREMEPMLRRTLTPAIKVTTVLADGLPPCIADRAQLEGAVLNLAINARDAMIEGGTLTIETGQARLDDDYVAINRDASAGDFVLICVTDTGCGMSPEVAARAFEPFFTTKPVGQGTGLGLSMVYGVIKQSGGHVKIYSEAGKGTTVRLYLPCAETNEPAALAFEREDPSALPRGSEAILLVEDDKPVRKVVRSQLKRLGYAVTDVADGQAAMNLLHDGHRVDLLLTDVVMSGGINGHELALAAKRLRPDLHIMFMSGYPAAVLASQGELDPCVRLLGKPFTITALAHGVREVLDCT